MAELVVTFQEKVDDLLIVDEEMDVEVRSLETCAYSTINFKNILDKIQKAVDDLSLRQYSNLHAWVGKLDEAVEEKLGLRLQAGIEAWTKALEGHGDKDENAEDEDTMDTHTKAKTANKLGGDPQIKRMLHDIRITNQIMYLHPSVEDCRYVLLQQLFAWQAVVTSQVCIHLHIVEKVNFLFKNSILTKVQHFHEFFSQFFFDNFSREIKVVNS